MTDPVPDSKPGTRWLWVALIVLMTLVFLFYIFNTDGGEEPVPVGETTGEVPNPLPTTTSVPVSPEGDFGEAPVNGEDLDPDVEIEQLPTQE